MRQQSAVPRGTDPPHLETYRRVLNGACLEAEKYAVRLQLAWPRAAEADRREAAHHLLVTLPEGVTALEARAMIVRSLRQAALDRTGQADPRLQKVADTVGVESEPHPYDEIQGEIATLPGRIERMKRAAAVLRAIEQESRRLWAKAEGHELDEELGTHKPGHQAGEGPATL